MPAPSRAEVDHARVTAIDLADGPWTWAGTAVSGATRIGCDATNTCPISSASKPVGANPNTTIVQIAPWVLYIRSIGSIGSINGSGFTESLDSGTQSWFFGTGGQANGSSPDITGINYNQANAVDFQAQYTASSSSNAVQVIGCQMRLRG